MHVNDQENVNERLATSNDRTELGPQSKKEDDYDGLESSSIDAVKKIQCFIYP